MMPLTVYGGVRSWETLKFKAELGSAYGDLLFDSDLRVRLLMLQRLLAVVDDKILCVDWL